MFHMHTTSYNTFQLQGMNPVFVFFQVLIPTDVEIEFQLQIYSQFNYRIGSNVEI